MTFAPLPLRCWAIRLDGSSVIPTYDRPPGRVAVYDQAFADGFDFLAVAPAAFMLAPCTADAERPRPRATRWGYHSST